MSGIECPICYAELIHEDTFGRFAGFGDRKIFGDIYRCPNGQNQDETCESEFHSVAGSWYAYREGDTSIKEGYPC